MDIYTAIQTRRTVRDFDDKPIEMDIIEKIIGAGLKAPTNDHMRSWEFVIVNDKSVRANILKIIPETVPLTKEGTTEMLDLWELTDTVQREMYLNAIPKQQDMLYNSGCLILPFFEYKESLLQPETLSSLNEFASIWCCIENMLLAAVSEGIFGVTRIPMENESQHIKNVIGYPDDYILPCYIGLGYPAKDAIINVQKKTSAKDKIHINKW
jgi:Nitroreductase